MPLNQTIKTVNAQRWWFQRNFRFVIIRDGQVYAIENLAILTWNIKTFNQFHGSSGIGNSK